MALDYPGPPKESSQALAEKALAGAAYLDLAQPGWSERIDTDTLDLGESRRCVIGQTMGRYVEGIEKLGLDGKTSISLGFNCNPRDYEALTAAWKPLIKERQPRNTSTVVHNGAVDYEVKKKENALVLTRTIPGVRCRSFEFGTDDPAILRQVGQAIIDLSS